MTVAKGAIDLGSSALNSAIRNPDGAAQVFRGLRRSLGEEQVDDFMRTLLQQAKSAIQPNPNPVLRGLKNTALVALPAGIAAGGAFLAGGGLKKTNDGKAVPADTSASTPSPNPDANTNNSNQGTTAFQSGQVEDPTSIDSFYQELIGIARDKQKALGLITSPGYLNEASQRQVDAQIAVNEPLLASIEARTNENSRRQESISRINAWKTIEQETIRANTAIAQSLAQIAYQSSIPNAGTLSALSPVVQAGANAFKPGASVLSSPKYP